MLKNELVSFSKYSVKNCYKQQLETISLSTLYNHIKDGYNTDLIYYIGIIRGASLIDIYNRQINVLKSDLPFVYLTGNRLYHDSEYDMHYNGNLHIDLDFKNDISAIGLKLLKEKLSEDKYIRMMFISPSGKGLKIVVSTNNYDVDNYVDYFYSYAHRLIDLYQIDSKYIDKLTAKHVCFMSYDKDCYYNPNASLYKALDIPFESGTSSNLRLVASSTKGIDVI